MKILILKNLSSHTVLLLFNLHSTTLGITYKFLRKCQTKNIDAETLPSADLNIISFGNESVVSQRTSQKGVIHTCSFHNARLSRGHLPNKPTESHTGYTEKGSICDRSGQRECPK